MRRQKSRRWRLGAVQHGAALQPWQCGCGSTVAVGASRGDAGAKSWFENRWGNIGVLPLGRSGVEAYQRAFGQNGRHAHSKETCVVGGQLRSETLNAVSRPAALTAACRSGSPAENAVSPWPRAGSFTSPWAILMKHKLKKEAPRIMMHIGTVDLAIPIEYIW
jgi:hypothetical protein